jgi:type VI secretion system protein VasJ
MPDDDTESNDEAPDRLDTDLDPDELSSFLETIAAPLSEDAPAGENVQYDEDFMALNREVEKISSVRDEPDYEAITDYARTVLTEKSKDLKTAGYLIVGAARHEGPEAMLEAVRAAHLLIDEYWEDLYPERTPGRGSALDFVSDHLSHWVTSTEFDQDDRSTLVTARDLLKEIQDFGLQEMGQHAPSLSGLLNDLESAIDDLPEPEPEPSPSDEADTDTEPDDTTDAQPSSSPSPAPSTPAAVGSESDASQVVTKAAAFLREQDRTDPTSYRLLRVMQWGVLQDEPPNDGGTTRIQPPREQRRTYLSGLLEDGDYETLVEEGESSFESEPFHLWLDLQRLVASALDALSTPYEAAYEAVMHDTARLVDRLPGLPGLAFSDGTPFAGPLTVDWIETEVQPLLEGGGEDSGSSQDGQLPATEQYEEARQRLTGGDLDEALSLMKEGATEDLSEKETFHRRLYVARLCLNGGQPAVARPLLDDLATAIERHDLDAWNPSLALEVWTHRCRCYDALAQQAEVDDKDALFAEADAAFENVCRLDATEAVSLAEQRPRAAS